MKVEKIDFISRQHGRWCVVAVTGRMDRTNAAEAGAELEKRLAANANLVLDLTEMDYISSAGMRILLRLAQQAEEAGKEYAIYCGNGFVKEVLEDSSMDMLIKVCASLDELG